MMHDKKYTFLNKIYTFEQKYTFLNKIYTVLNKNTIPFSITTINDSGNGTLLIGTTSGQIFELTLP